MKKEALIFFMAEITLCVYCNGDFQQSMKNKMMQELERRLAGAISLRRCEGAEASVHGEGIGLSRYNVIHFQNQVGKQSVL